MKIFIVYGGREGEGYGDTINNYFKQHNLGSFLASRQSADMHAGVDVPNNINDNLLNAEIAIMIITPELEDSEIAMSEIDQIIHQLMIPFVPYRRRDSTIPPILLDKQYVEFVPPLDENALKNLELEMWHSFDIWRTSIQRTSENQSVEVSYIG